MSTLKRIATLCQISTLWLLFTLSSQAQPRVDSTALLSHVYELSADSYKGREAGTPENEKARTYIENYFDGLDLHRFNGSYRAPFEAGINVIGYIQGTENPHAYIVVTAHFDHLGIRNGEIYNGADDNASGTAALMELAAYFRRHPLKHSIIFAALDAEEKGLQGARAFVANPPVPASTIGVNVNMDMISYTDKNELYASGTYHYPFLKPYLETVATASEVTLLFGHDIPGTGHDDWTLSSDHGPFHQTWGLPFVYFGVEDHPNYHQPTDDFENINPAFFVDAVETILAAIVKLDAHLPEIMAKK